MIGNIKKQMFIKIFVMERIDPTDDKFKDSNRMIAEDVFQKYRPKECLDKLWKESGCTDGRYHPDKMKDFHDKGKLQNNSHYIKSKHGWSSTI